MLPEKILAGALEWEVMVGRPDDGDYAETDIEKTRITVSEDIFELMREVYFVHELMHVACHFAGVEDGETLTEEQICTRLSPIWHSILRQNNAWFPSRP